jgi:hypothetical protein
MRRISYRIGQFFRVSAASLSPLSAAEAAEARAHLPATAWPLFAATARADQRHGLSVLRAMLAAGHTESALLQAALLHDCAKTAGGVRLWQRVAAVLLKAFAPRRLARLAAQPAPRPADPRRGLWDYVNHPQRGAELAAVAGCDPLAVALIVQHQERGAVFPDDPLARQLLVALQAADEDN